MPEAVLSAKDARKAKKAAKDAAKALAKMTLEGNEEDTAQGSSSETIFESADVEDFSSGVSGEGQYTNELVTKLGSGKCAIIKDRPCKVSKISKKQNGKHSHITCTVEAIDLFTNKKYTDIFSGHDHVRVPKVTSDFYEVVDLEENGPYPASKDVSLMTQSGEMHEGVQLPPFPDGYAKQLQELFLAGKRISVMVVKYGDEELITSHRTIADGE
jgi:translation initiation factor 5A